MDEQREAGLRPPARQSALPLRTLAATDGRQCGDDEKVVEQTLTQGNDYVEYMLHSSEYMPGGSPTFQNERDIERLYADLEAFFSWLAPQVKGMTLAEYYQRKITQR